MRHLHIFIHSHSLTSNKAHTVAQSAHTMTHKATNRLASSAASAQKPKALWTRPVPAPESQTPHLLPSLGRVRVPAELRISPRRQDPNAGPLWILGNVVQSQSSRRQDGVFIPHSLGLARLTLPSKAFKERSSLSKPSIRPELIFPQVRITHSESLIITGRCRQVGRGKETERHMNVNQQSLMGNVV